MAKTVINNGLNLVGGYIKISGVRKEIIKIYYNSTKVYEKQVPPTTYTAYADTLTGCRIQPALPVSIDTSATFTITPDIGPGEYAVFSSLTVGSTSGGTDIIDYNFRNHVGVTSFTISPVTSNAYITSIYNTDAMRVGGPFSQRGTAGTTVDSGPIDIIEECRIRGDYVRSWSDLQGHRVIINMGVAFNSTTNYTDVTVDMNVERTENSQLVLSTGSGLRIIRFYIVYNASGLILRVQSGRLATATAYALINYVIIY